MELSETTIRQRWMGVLARASRTRLATLMADFAGCPKPEIVRPAETGTVMAEGRAGGTGARFNVGEVTATRCVVRVEGRLGFSYALGRDRVKAELAAALDALLQNPERQDALLAKIITPLAQEEAAARALASRKAAATKVDFFTLIRGDE
jgi:phosphonate C-P lyase system protein PhnG